MNQQEDRGPAYEKATARRSHAANPKEVEMCERFFGHLTDGFNRLPRTITWQELNGTILQLATLGHDSLRWAFEMLLKGYYTQANAMSRMAFECWLNSAYLLLYPNQVDNWREFKSRPRPAKLRELVAARVAELGSGVAEDFTSQLSTVYSSYSDFSHPTDMSLKVLLERDHSGEDFQLRLGGSYVESLLIQSADMFCFASEMLFTLFYVMMQKDSEYYRTGSDLRAELALWREDIARRVSQDANNS